MWLLQPSWVSLFKTLASGLGTLYASDKHRNRFPVQQGQYFDIDKSLRGVGRVQEPHLPLPGSFPPLGVGWPGRILLLVADAVGIFMSSDHCSTSTTVCKWLQMHLQMLGLYVRVELFYSIMYLPNLDCVLTARHTTLNLAHTRKQKTRGHPCKSGTRMPDAKKPIKAHTYLVEYTLTKGGTISLSLWT